MTDTGQVTYLLSCWTDGDGAALDKLTPLVYAELRRLAAGFIRRERSGHTLQPTALVHEAYLRLVDQEVSNLKCRAQFFAVASKLMREILVNHAKRRGRLKRGAGNLTVLNENIIGGEQRSEDLVALDEALDRLAQLNSRQSRIVELRFFAGLKEEEIAQILEVSLATVKRDWRVARAALHRELHKTTSLRP